MVMAAIYARVSSTRQKEEHTIDSQTAAIRTFAEQQGLEVCDEWTFEDAGVSGATLVRPALDRLRDLIAQVPVEVVLVYSPDRLARRYAYQELLIEEFARAGTEVRFVNAPAGDTPEDRLLVQFQGMIAEYERAQIAERTRRGKPDRARAGSVNVLGGAPYGYRYVKLCFPCNRSAEPGPSLSGHRRRPTASRPPLRPSERRDARPLAPPLRLHGKPRRQEVRRGRRPLRDRRAPGRCGA